jgi:hypothetical protein
MKTKLAIVGLAIHFVFSSLSYAYVSGPSCPLGPGETELTVSRIMRNFGRGTLPAEKVAQAKNDPSVISDFDLKAAIEGNAMAEACAAAVLDDTEQKLLPSRADEFTGAARDAYVAKYLSHMNEFSASVVTLDSLLRQSLATRAASRDFHAIALQVQEVKECATRAHGDL